MRKLPSTTGSDGYSQVSGEVGYAETSPGKAFFQDLIQKANSVPITLLFKHFKVVLSEYSPKTTCPFKSHKGGRERSPSFWYYAETNTYCCFGCRNGSRPVDFVAAMQGLTRSQAAYWILERFGSELDEGFIFDGPDYTERLNIMMDFANTVRNFRQSYVDPESTDFIEGLCAIYDSLNLKHNLENPALLRVVEQLKEKITSYTPCPMP
jgi:DNA primase